jgi:hypothetical protein
LKRLSSLALILGLVIKLTWDKLNRE